MHLFGKYILIIHIIFFLISYSNTSCVIMPDTNVDYIHHVLLCLLLTLTIYIMCYYAYY